MPAVKPPVEGPYAPPERAGFAADRGEGHHAGWTERGRAIRSGIGVFVGQAWSMGKGDKLTGGVTPARLARSYGLKDDRLGKWRMYVEIMSGWQYEQLVDLPGFNKFIPPELIDLMAKNPSKIFLEGSIGYQEEYESMTEDIEIAPLRMDRDGRFDLQARAPPRQTAPNIGVRRVACGMPGGWAWWGEEGGGRWL